MESRLKKVSLLKIWKKIEQFSTICAQGIIRVATRAYFFFEFVDFY